MIPVLCPHCDRGFRTMTEGMGKTAVCSGCARSFVIGAKRPDFNWEAHDWGLDSWVGVSPPDEGDREEIKHCIICDAPLAPGDVRCRECGANQVTGVVQKKRPTPAPERMRMGSILPIRWILTFMVMAVIAGAGYFLFLKLAHSLHETGEQLAEQNTALAVSRLLDKGGDRFDLETEFGGKVTDENLSSYVRMLSAGRPDIQEAAVVLIGCGHMTQLSPLIEWGQGADVDRRRFLSVLDAIGERRLVELSCHEDAEIRKSAATAMVMAFGDPDENASLIDALAEPTPLTAKQILYNQQFRSWPEATGDFEIEANGQVAPIRVVVTQFGRTFYFQMGERVFRTSFDAPMSLRIPIERWCEATGTAVDVEALRESVEGRVRLASPNGVGWRGTLRVIARQQLRGPLPGFVPIEPPSPGREVEIEVSLGR